MGNPELRDSRGLAFARESGLPVAAAGTNLEPLSPGPLSQNTHCFPANMPSSQLVLLGKAGELTVTLPASRKEGLPRTLSGRWGGGAGGVGA